MNRLFIANQEIWIGMYNIMGLTCNSAATCDRKLAFEGQYNRYFDASSVPSLTSFNIGLSPSCLLMTASGGIKNSNCNGQKKYICEIHCDALPLQTNPVVPSGVGCITPFIHRGYTFNSCTCFGTASVAQCATAVDASNRATTMTDCNLACRKHLMLE